MASRGAHNRAVCAPAQRDRAKAEDRASAPAEGEEAPAAQVMDLMAALEESVAKARSPAAKAIGPARCTRCRRRRRARRVAGDPPRTCPADHVTTPQRSRLRGHGAAPDRPSYPAPYSRCLHRRLNARRFRERTPYGHRAADAPGHDCRNVGRSARKGRGIDPGQPSTYDKASR